MVLEEDSFSASDARRRRGDGHVGSTWTRKPLSPDQRADILVPWTLGRLAELDERAGRVVECRFFGGLTEEETARTLGVTERTVRRIGPGPRPGSMMRFGVERGGPVLVRWRFSPLRYAQRDT
jgi:hypothetical protein